MYSACNLAASFLVASRQDWKLLPLLPPVFACYHFGYGLGFLHGVRDFLILRRGPDHTYTRDNPYFIEAPCLSPCPENFHGDLA